MAPRTLGSGSDRQNSKETRELRQGLIDRLQAEEVKGNKKVPSHSQTAARERGKKRKTDIRIHINGWYIHTKLCDVFARAAANQRPPFNRTPPIP
jgi:hypothetical protein